MDRRVFLKTSAMLSAVPFMEAASQVMPQKKDVLNVALLGAGAQGQTLLDACLKLGKDSGIRFVAVCDIWEKFNLRKVSRRLKAYHLYGHEGRPYTDYRQMLDTETDLDAVLIATPDFCHAEHTVACLEKGLHVYCEKQMSHTLEGARKMVVAARKSGKLLQIGHQRRSNPQYLHCYHRYLNEARLFGTLTAVKGQWNRSRASCLALDWPEGTEIDEATLQKYGYESMHQLRNWRLYKRLSAGPIADVGSHQIDVYNWFLGARPVNVLASGTVGYWKDRQWYDNVMTILEYQVPTGVVQAFYQASTSNGADGYYECFMGDQGTLLVSEASTQNRIYLENGVPEETWEPWVAKGYLQKAKGKSTSVQSQQTLLDVREGSYSPAEYHLPVSMTVPYHQPHLVNFFEAIRGNAILNCPAEAAYQTTVSTLKINEAIEKGGHLTFSEDEFKV